MVMLGVPEHVPEALRMYNFILLQITSLMLSECLEEMTTRTVEQIQHFCYE